MASRRRQLSATWFKEQETQPVQQPRTVRPKDVTHLPTTRPSDPERDAITGNADKGVFTMPSIRRRLPAPRLPKEMDVGVVGERVSSRSYGPLYSFLVPTDTRSVLESTPDKPFVLEECTKDGCEGEDEDQSGVKEETAGTEAAASAPSKPKPPKKSMVNRFHLTMSLGVVHRFDSAADRARHVHIVLHATRSLCLFAWPAWDHALMSLEQAGMIPNESVLSGVQTVRTDALDILRCVMAWHEEFYAIFGARMFRARDGINSKDARATTRLPFLPVSDLVVDCYAEQVRKSVLGEKADPEQIPADGSKWLLAEEERAAQDEKTPSHPPATAAASKQQPKSRTMRAGGGFSFDDVGIHASDAREHSIIPRRNEDRGKIRKAAAVSALQTDGVFEGVRWKWNVVVVARREEDLSKLKALRERIFMKDPSAHLIYDFRKRAGFDEVYRQRLAADKERLHPLKSTAKKANIEATEADGENPEATEATAEDHQSEPPMDAIDDLTPAMKLRRGKIDLTKKPSAVTMSTGERIIAARKLERKRKKDQAMAQRKREQMLKKREEEKAKYDKERKERQKLAKANAEEAAAQRLARRKAMREEAIEKARRDIAIMLGEEDP